MRINTIFLLINNCARRNLISYSFDSEPSLDNILHVAAKQGSIEKVSEILNSGIITINSCNFTGKSVLLLAASYGHLDLVRWLLSHGSNIAEIDDFGQTAFQLAASHGYLEIIKWLYLNFKIDVNQKTRGSENAFGDNALILASGGGHLEVVKWLILCVTANITERNNHGCNALDVAVKYKHDSIVSFLLRVGAGIKACLDAPFFDTFSFKDVFIMGATKNKRSVKDLNNDNFVDAIATPEILQRQIRKNNFCYIHIIRNTLIENLNRISAGY